MTFVKVFEFVIVAWRIDLERYIPHLATHILTFLIVSKGEKKLLFWRDNAVTKDSFVQSKTVKKITKTRSVWKIIFDSKEKNHSNRLKNKFHLNKNSVPTSEWTHYIYITNSNRLISFNEIIATGSDSNATIYKYISWGQQYINTFREDNAKILCVNPSVTQRFNSN
jgi:hypothetical protein